MKQRPTGRPSSEKIIRDIKRNTRKQYSAEEKIRIVLDGVRGEDSIAGLRNPRGERCSTPSMNLQILFSRWERS